MKCVAVTPEKTVVERETKFVVVPLFDGEYAIGVGHSPVVGRLGAGELRLTLEDDSVERWYVEGGFVEAANDVVSLLTTRACKFSELDLNEATQALNDALNRPATSPELREIKTKAVATARSRIKKTATRIKTKEEVGVGLARLNEIYKTATLAQDGKTALAAEKERCKLLALYDKIEERETKTVDREKDEARRWLESALTDVENVGSLGLDDLARIAVYRIVGKETS
ncbi:MAG: F0F1 ATP synthase subunit epsilon [Thermoguttaceae bacterium]|nr:F0F1 ATP synthase subunit epsilon [Thermoguttaceae bacterium]